MLFTTRTFSLMNTGNRTLYAPKRSWKIDVEPGDDDDGTLGLERLNLKSMYNDPSQMREALAWHLFDQAGIPAARHTYARVALNGVYRGLYSVIEQVDKRFVNTWFGKGDRGNLYKAYCRDIGCATLEHRRDAAGDDSGKQYRGNASEDRTYRLKTNEDDPAANTYDDLAALIRVINGIGMPATSFGSDAYRDAIDQILDVWTFLRWASYERAARRLGQLLRHARQLLPLQLRTARRTQEVPRCPALHVHSLGLRQQFRHRLFRHRLAVHRSPRLAGQYGPVLAPGGAS